MSRIETLAWFDGRTLPVQEIRIPALSHSLHYGTGVFEGVRAYRQHDGGTGVFRLDDHLERFLLSARIVGFELPYGRPELQCAVLELLRANEMVEGYLRPLAFLGEGAMGVAGGHNPVHVLIAVWTWGSYLGEAGRERGVAVAISSYERPTANAAAIRAKVTGQYVTPFMAKRAALAAGFDEAVLLDRDGYLAEGSGENLFLARGGALYTPPTSAPILHGITRASVITLAHDLGIEVREERLGRTDLYAADEAFLTGTAAEVTPVRAVDGRPLPSSPGPLTRRLQASFFATIRGAGERSRAWVTRDDGRMS